jgi:molecular chaperone HscB
MAGPTCWSCRGEAEAGAPFCPACAAIQPAPHPADPFALLGLPRRFELEPGEIEGRLRDLSRRLHPDRFARKSPRERRHSLEWSTRVNDAVRALRDWRLRAAALLRLSGTDALAEGRTHDPEFLEEQLGWREAMALARADGDAARLAGIAERARARLGELEAEVAGLFRREDRPGSLGAEIARHLARARTYESVVADAERPARLA